MRVRSVRARIVVPEFEPARVRFEFDFERGEVRSKFDRTAVPVAGDVYASRAGHLAFHARGDPGPARDIHADLDESPGVVHGTVATSSRFERGKPSGCVGRDPAIGARSEEAVEATRRPKPAERRILHPRREIGAAVVVPRGARRGGPARGHVRARRADDRIERFDQARVVHVAGARDRARTGGISRVRHTCDVAGTGGDATIREVPRVAERRSVRLDVCSAVAGRDVVGRGAGVSAVHRHHLVGGGVGITRSSVAAVRGGDGRPHPAGGVSAPHGQKAGEKSSDEGQKQRRGLHGETLPERLF